MPYRFRRDMHLQFRGREYVVEARLPSGDLRLRDIAFNESKPVPESTLVEALFAGELEFLGDRVTTLVQRKLAQNFVDDFSLLEEDDPRKVEATRRYAYVKALDEQPQLQPTATVVRPILQRVHADIRDPKEVPGWKVVYYKWRGAWLTAGRDLRALVPQYKRRGNTKTRLGIAPKPAGVRVSESELQKAVVVERLLEETINELYLNPQQLTVPEVHKRLELRIDDENRYRAADDQLPVPHESSVFRAVSRLDEYEKDVARLGKRLADIKHRSNQKGAEYTRPLQRAEYDDTPSDLFVVDTQTRLPLGRLTLTFAIDCYSRMPLGMNVGFDGPGYLAIMRCMLHAIRPKTYLKQLYPRVQNDWPCYGVHEEMGVDNGSGYISEALSEACAVMGIVISHSPVRRPETKGRIERFLGTLNREQLHSMPGTTFSSIVDRADYDPRKNALIALDALMEVLHIFQVDDYARRPHRGLKDIPINCWNEGVRLYPPAMPRREADLRALLGYTEKRVIGSNGIDLFTLQYNCDELALLRRRQKGEQVKVKYDPSNISVVYAFDPDSDRFITVPALDQAYTQNLSLWQHNVIKKYARTRLRQSVDREGLCRARRAIQEIVDAEWSKGGKTGTRTKLARWKGIRQPDYSAAMETHAQLEAPAATALESRGNLVRLNPAPVPVDGISDFANTLTIEATATVEDGAQLPLPVPATTTMALVPNDKTNKKQARRKTAKKPVVPEQENRLEEPGGDDAPDDDDLDLTGFSASYDLPVRNTP